MNPATPIVRRAIAYPVYLVSGLQVAIHPHPHTIEEPSEFTQTVECRPPATNTAQTIVHRSSDIGCRYL